MRFYLDLILNNPGMMYCIFEFLKMPILWLILFSCHLTVDVFSSPLLSQLIISSSSSTYNRGENIRKQHQMKNHLDGMMNGSWKIL